MKFLVVYEVKEGKWKEQYTIEYNTYEEMLNSINNLAWNWKVLKVYEIAKEIEV